MKRLIVSMLAGAMSLAAFQAIAADKVTLQLKWVTQSQFAGYYVAKAKGFYDEEGLDVDIKPGGPDIAPEQVIAGGGADVIVDWMGGALAAREKGVPLVNIAQPFKKAGMEMVCPKDGPIKTEADFKGHTLGVWFYGNEYPFFAWMNKLGLSTEGGADGVTVLKQSFDVQPLIQKQADCISVMTYNEYWQLIDAGFKPEDLIVFNYSAMGNDLARRRALCARGQAQGSGLRGQDGALRARLDEGLEIRHRQFGRGGRHRRREWRPGREPPEAHDGRDRQADRQRRRQARRSRLSAYRQGAARPEDHHQGADRRLDGGDHRQGDQIVAAHLREREGAGDRPFFVGVRQPGQAAPSLIARA